MVLTDSGAAADPQALVPRVYLPEREGSLQVELKAAARSYGRIPYETSPSLRALVAEVEAGRPVLVLQNLGFDWLPRWHYAVVVGFDADRGLILLRSGRTKRLRERLASFDRSWRLADRWGLLLLRPGELPAADAPQRYLGSVLDSIPEMTLAEVTAALQAGVQRWALDADLNFALANQLRRNGQISASAERYRECIAIDGEHSGALNNFADLLLEQGCVAAAKVYATRAEASVPADSPLLPLIRSTIREIDLAGTETGTLAGGDGICSELASTR